MLVEPAAKTEAENHTLSSSAEAAETAEAALVIDKGTKRYMPKAPATSAAEVENSPATALALGAWRAASCLRMAGRMDWELRML